MTLAFLPMVSTAGEPMFPVPRSAPNIAREAVFVCRPPPARCTRLATVNYRGVMGLALTRPSLSMLVHGAMPGPTARSLGELGRQQQSCVHAVLPPLLSSR